MAGWRTTAGPAKTEPPTATTTPGPPAATTTWKVSG
jgi:hypothetical protein